MAKRSTIEKRNRTRRRNAAKRRRIGRQSAGGRLWDDGAASAEQINRRALWLAREWQLPRCPKIGNTMSEAVAAYCKKHGVNLDWLLGGCLKGLQKMLHARKYTPSADERLKQKLAALSPAQRKVVANEVERMIGELGYA